MKRLLALLLVVVMLFAVLALASCGDEPDVTTGPSETTPKATEGTTTQPTEPTTVPTEPTTEPTTVPTEPTTVPTEPTTEPTTVPTEPTTEPTTATQPTTATTITSGTTVGVFARFDFGTKTKAEAEGKTSHAYLTSILTYSKACLNVSFTDDTVVIYAIKDYAEDDSFSLNFDDIVTYDFDDELKYGYGAWSGQPFTDNNVGKTWAGNHQYCKIRIKNPTVNNMWSFNFMPAGSAFYTTQVASNLYLQGGAPTSKSSHNTETTPLDEWRTYTYNIAFLAGLGSGRPNGVSGKSYYEYVEWANNGNDMGNNWVWQNGNSVAGLRFHFLGAAYAYGKGTTEVAACDSRKNIKQGNHVEVDYVVFGASVEQLSTWTSYLEDSAK